MKKVFVLLSLSILLISSCEGDISSTSFSSQDIYDDKELFYENYQVATSLEESRLRSEHHLMSGSIESQWRQPTKCEEPPIENDLYVRNTSAYYEDDGYTYVILDSNGEIANKIFYGGAYVTLEEVASYVYAFGETPINYVEDKLTSPTKSPWGEYLRLNNTFFEGGRSDEPALPFNGYISEDGIGYRYYEIDIGADNYNNGKRIKRGSCRLVYTRYYLDGSLITDPNDRYVFYTYTHYSSFLEYLNYENGWGQEFGFDNNYIPTEYQETYRLDLSAFN